MMIKHKPRSLIIHLKRFRIDYRTNYHQKLGTRIPFPQELRIESALDDVSGENPILYNLTGIIVHMGQGYAYGHYFALAKSRGRWIRFDDTRVDAVEEKEMRMLFGKPEQ
jgi:ubiquitin C-terminal hydrolase